MYGKLNDLQVGGMRKYNPTEAGVHFDRPLSNLSVAYFQNPEYFVATKIFPYVNVNKRSDKYWTYDREFFNRNEVEKRAPGTEAGTIDWKLSDDSYFCEKYSIAYDIYAEVAANEDPEVRLESTAVRLLANKMLLKKEIDWVDNFFTTGVWTDNSDGLDWSDASSEPIKDVAEAMDDVHVATTFRPNTMVMSAKVYTALKHHPSFLSRVNAGQTPGGPAKVTKQLMAELFEVDNIYVLQAVQNTKKEGLGETNAFIGSDHALLLYVPSSPGLQIPSAGYTFSWSGFNGAMGNMGTSIKTYPIIHLDIDKRIENTMFWDQKLIGADLGYMFPNIISGAGSS